MKHFKFLAIAASMLMAVTALSFTACNGDDSEEEFKVVPLTLEFDAAGGTKDLTVTGSWDQQPTTEATWITLSTTATKVSVTAAANAGEARTATIKIGTANITVTQQTSTPTIMANPTTLTFAASGATAQTVTITTANIEGDWDATPSASWIKVTPSTGIISVTVEDNPGTTPRSGNITIAVDGYDVNAVVSVTQNAPGSTEGPELTITAVPGDADGNNKATKAIIGILSPNTTSAMYGFFSKADISDSGLTFDELITTYGDNIPAQYISALKDGLGITFSGLTPNTTYVAIVKASNANGSTLESAEVTTDELGELVTRELNNLTQGLLLHYGDAYGLPTNNYSNWTVYLADATFDMDNFTGTGDVMQLELNTAKGVTTEITPGTYNVMASRAAGEFVSFTCVPGYISSKYVYGSAYIFRAANPDDEYYSLLTSGFVTVAKAGNTYTFTFELTDTSSNILYKGSYTGVPEYSDESTPPSGMSAISNNSGRSIATGFSSKVSSITHR